jgi:hypothetical protein
MRLHARVSLVPLERGDKWRDDLGVQGNFHRGLLIAATDPKISIESQCHPALGWQLPRNFQKEGRTPMTNDVLAFRYRHHAWSESYREEALLLCGS